MTTTFKSRNPATCKSNTQIQKISSPKFQQVCCWLALKIKPWWKKKKKNRSTPSSHHHNQYWDWSGHEFHLSKEPKTPSEYLDWDDCCVFSFMFSSFSFSFSFFSFFFYTWTVTSHGFTLHALFITVHALKNIKNGSHDTIHTFKNYFATVLSVFNFQFQQQ